MKTLIKYWFIFLLLIIASAIGSYIGITVFYNLPAFITMDEDR